MLGHDALQSSSWAATDKVPVKLRLCKFERLACTKILHFPPAPEACGEVEGEASELRPQLGTERCHTLCRVDGEGSDQVVYLGVVDSVGGHQGHQRL